MASMFPYRDKGLKLKGEVNGPSEMVLYYFGGIIGGYLGWRFGSEFAELANQTIQDSSTIETIVKNHPLATKLITCAAGSISISDLMRLPGKLIDKIIGTYHK